MGKLSKYRSLDLRIDLAASYGEFEWSINEILERAISKDVEGIYIHQHIDTLPLFAVKNRELRSSIRKVRFVSQVRVAGGTVIKLYHNKQAHLIKTNEICTICNLLEEETLYDILVKCPIYQNLRQHYLGDTGNMDAIVDILIIKKY